MAEPGEPLTERELEVVRLLATGASNKEIATGLIISPNTVKVHLRNIFVKLEADSRTSVTMTAVRNGWVAVNQSNTSRPGAPTDANGRPVAAIFPVSGLVPTGPDAASAEQSTPDAAIAIPAAMVVRVAPNPLALPALSGFRRASMAIAVVATIVAGASLLSGREPAASASGPITLRQNTPSVGGGLRFPGESSRWFERGRLPAAREFAVAATAGNRAYLIGGVVGALATGDVLVYDPKANGWETGGAPKPTAIGIAAAATLGGRIYVSGGVLSNDTPTNRFEVFDPETGLWQSLAPLPAPLAGHVSAVLGDLVFVFGGYSGQGLNPESYAYDPATNAWQKRAPIPTPRGLAAAAPLGDRIFVVGGQADGQDRPDCDAYSPASDTWSPCPRMNLRRSAFGLAATGGALYAVGGGGANYLGFSERFDPALNTWTLFETPKFGDWRNIAVTAIPAGIVVAGGRNGSERLRDTYFYELVGNRAFLPALTQQQPTVP